MNNSNIQLKILNTLFVLFTISIASVFLMDLFTSWSFTSWQISEFLINYQGGFVRRGLTGEILFHLATHTGFNVMWIIKLLSVVCCVFVCGFFIRSFFKKGYPLYILPLCFFCGGIIFSQVWIRKDFMMFCFFIPILLIYIHQTIPSWLKWLLVNILSILMILNHEVSAFFTLPVLFILLFHDIKKFKKSFFISGIFSIFVLLPVVFTFILVSIRHGDITVSQTIWDSWGKFVPEGIATHEFSCAVKAIGWSTMETLNRHFKINFLIEENYILSFGYWLIIFPVVYYISTNVLLVFKKQPDVFTKEDRNILSSILCFQFLCLLPMFIALSIDYLRIFFYLTASAFAFFLIIPKTVIIELFPKFWMRFIEKLNTGFDRILPPKRTTVAFFMLTVGISYSGFVLKTIWMSTMIYRIFLLLSQPVILFRDYFFQ